MKSSQSVCFRCGQQLHHFEQSWNTGYPSWKLQAVSVFSSSRKVPAMHPYR